MSYNSSRQETTRSNTHGFITLLLILILLLGAASVAAIWLLIEPVHVVSGAVRIRPVIINPWTGESSSGETVNYEQFVNTQAFLLLNDERRLQSVIDDLVPRDLEFFTDRPRNRIEALIGRSRPKEWEGGPDRILREAIARKQISAEHRPNSELLVVTMKSYNAEEGRTIIDSFLRNYVGQYGRESALFETEEISTLERRRNELQKRVFEGRGRILALAESFGTTVPDPLRKMEMNRQNLLMDELARLESQSIRLNAEIGVLEETGQAEVSPEQIAALRANHVNADPLVQTLAQRIVNLQVDLVSMQTGAQEPDELTAVERQEAVLQALRRQLDERQRDCLSEFEEVLTDLSKSAGRHRLAEAQAKLQQVSAHKEHLRRALVAQETRTHRIGTTRLDIGDHEYRLRLDEELLEQVTRRLRDMELMRDRRPRVQIASRAEVTDVVDNRWRWTLVTVGAIILLSIVLGITKRVTNRR